MAKYDNAAEVEEFYIKVTANRDYQTALTKAHALFVPAPTIKCGFTCKFVGLRSARLPGRQLSREHHSRQHVTGAVRNPQWPRWRLWLGQQKTLLILELHPFAGQFFKIVGLCK